MTAGGGAPALPAGMADLLLEAARRRRSGLLYWTRGRHRRIFCFESGSLRYAASNVLEEQLESFLQESGHLSAQQVAQARREAHERKLPVPQVLRERMWMPPDALAESVAEHARGLLLDSLEAEDAAASFEAGRPNLAGVPVCDLPALALFLDRYRRWPRELDTVKLRLGPPSQKLAPAGEDAWPGALASLPPEFRRVLEAADGKRGLLDVVQASGLEPAEAFRAVLGLKEAGLLDTGAAPAERTSSRRDEAPLTEEEVRAVLQRARHADYYAMLGLERGAGEARIREAYYTLARRYHPDRFRTGPLHSFLADMEAFFSRVTEAYNTLSSPELRREYDASLEDHAADARAGADVHARELARQNYLRGRALEDERRYQEAVRFYENAVELDPSRPEYRLGLGSLLATNPRLRPQAEAALLEALRLDPTSARACRALAELYRRAGRLNRALRFAEEALRWEPGAAENRTLVDGLRREAAGAQDPVGHLMEGVFQSERA